MQKKLIALLIGLTVTFSTVAIGAKVKTQPVKVQAPAAIQTVNALDVVACPTKYLNKKIKVKAKFDKFSTLGLDYKPAYKSSEDYITFLIKRDDVVNYVVPLSEMKNFLPRKIAEKYIDLKPGDEIEYVGTVFSDALSDTWVEVESFEVIKEVFKEKQPE
ncbi:hypothetical protein IJ732_07660 [bacterium]|nr:hypothetical protein [bacterium]